jgi:hypothetical protein
VKRIDALAGAARRNRTSLNVLCTLRGRLDLPENESKRQIVRQTAHLGEALKRRGQPHIGVTVFEKAPHLHGHHLVYVDPENDDVVATYADQTEFHARPADRYAPEYITKQRRWLGPRFETGRQWEPSGGEVPGKRYTMTTAAEALIQPKAASRETVTPAVEAAQEAAPVTVTLADGQLELFALMPARPPSAVIDLRVVREKLGYTQEQITPLLGLKNRSHVANIERGHDRLSAPRARVLRHLIDTANVAA